MIELEKCHSECEVYTTTLHGSGSYTSVYTSKDYDDTTTSHDKRHVVERISGKRKRINQRKQRVATQR